VTRLIVALIAYLALVATTGCSGVKSMRNEGFNPARSLRVAVLPFDKAYAGRNLPTGAIDSVPVLGEKVSSGEDFVRRAVYRELRDGAYDLVAMHYIDTLLAHAGWYKDHAFLKQDSRKLGALLKVDALLVGRVTAWDIDYLGLETLHSVAFELQLIHVPSGQVLATVEVNQEGSAGLSGGPTGYPDAVLEPIRALSSARLVELGQKAAQLAAEELLPSQEDRKAARRQAPYLLYATHDQPAGMPVQPGQVITVAAQGAPGARANASLEGAQLSVPMSEVREGIYIGHFVLPPKLEIIDDLVIVTLTSPSGFSSTATVDHKPLSTP